MSITLNKIKVGIVGGSGYTGGELIRLITNHPKSELIFVHSNVNSGIYISDIHQDLIGETEMKFQNKLNYDIDVLFLCLGHGKSNEFLNNNNIETMIHYPYMLNELRFFKNFNKLKNSNNLGKKIISLPISEEHTKKEIIFISNKIEEFFSKRG